MIIIIIMIKKLVLYFLYDLSSSDVHQNERMFACFYQMCVCVLSTPTSGLLPPLSIESF
jgi:hypothetical protein